MKSEVLIALYKQLMFFSDNGKEVIENPAIAISEACKCVGCPRTDVREALQTFEAHGFIRQVDDPRLKFVITEAGRDQVKVEELINTLPIT
ncbi:hypothetical protein [Hymenobacter sp. APR13]|uniref:hypothetical protein n=1 Tax=Hymenobacter sp. APR13 TaxID=1356852 RepID=UPI0004E07FA5|nr:hypothetical protein [Hymenobacter sp. APR13]AII53880.1 hypothetical protein N008_18090 [Hymenobacter sp. APR13]